MKTTLYYFSGTGNSLKVGRDLASLLEDTELISIPKIIKQDKITLSGERIGIIYPVYIGGMPLIISELITKLEAGSDKYIFAIATYGRMAGAALKQTARKLKEKGLKLSAGFAVLMPGNYTPLYGAISEKKQASMFEKEKRHIQGIASIVREGKSYKIQTSFFLINWIGSILYKIESPKIPKMDSSFLSTEKCNSCGICEQVCPVDNIKLQQGRPVWAGCCQQCFACLQWCPQEAIEWGKSTVGRKRYHHPEIKLNELIYK
jgi:NAD-dependent dihydropyrimidine dehydrogenase PreA subunit/flavodoxin